MVFWKILWSGILYSCWSSLLHGQIIISQGFNKLSICCYKHNDMVFWKVILFGIPYSCWSSLLHGWITISPADLICINKIFSNEFRDLFFFVSSLCFIFAEDITLLVHLYIYILLFLSVICVGNELFCTFHSCLRKRKNICMLLEISLTDIHVPQMLFSCTLISPDCVTLISAGRVCICSLHNLQGPLSFESSCCC